MHLSLDDDVDEGLVLCDIGHHSLGDVEGVVGCAGPIALSELGWYREQTELILFEEVVGLVLVQVEVELTLVKQVQA